VGIQLASGLVVIKNQTLVTGLVIVMTPLAIDMARIVINDKLSIFLENVEIREERNVVQEHVAIEHNSARGHAQSAMDGCSSSVKSSG
jgi:hypothetical protein